jgi:hypothetical protein
MEVAQQRFLELLDVWDFDPKSPRDDYMKFDTAEYGRLKEMVFTAIADGLLLQSYNDTENIVQISVKKK